MPRLAAAEIYEVCLSAGFAPDQAVTMTAIALAESGGRIDAHEPGGEGSSGLWQINVEPGGQPDRWGDLTDPHANARAAYEISGGGHDITPWTVTHGSGAGHDYQDFMAEARAAAARVAHPGDVTGVAGADDPPPGDEPTAGAAPPSAHVAISLGDGTTIEGSDSAFGMGSLEPDDGFPSEAAVPGDLTVSTGTFGVDEDLGLDPPAWERAGPDPLDVEDGGVAGALDLDDGTEVGRLGGHDEADGGPVEA